MMTHFAVSTPHQLLCLDEPQVCPFLPGLRFEGIAVTAGGQHHLVMVLGEQDRFFLGPDRDTVARRAMILLVGLRIASQGEVDDFHGDLIRQWVTDAWDAVVDQVAARIAGPALAVLASTEEPW